MFTTEMLSCFGLEIYVLLQTKRIFACAVKIAIVGSNLFEKVHLKFVPAKVEFFGALFLLISCCIDFLYGFN